jgi:HPt (histidine-containing phosphotransfer) domain-containing protein
MEIKTPDKFKGKDAFYLKMLRMLVRDFPDEWKSFDAVVADMENSKTYIHKIKGAAGNLDMKPVYESAVAFEASMRNNTPDSGLYKAFIDACEDLRNSLPPAE